MTSHSSVAPVQVTPEDLLTIRDAINYELVDGKLVGRHSGMESSKVGARILGMIGMFLGEPPRGHLFGADASYQCFDWAPRQVRKPDGSYIRPGRFPDERVPKGHCPIPPDLAVEVISPGDLADEVEEKVSEYLRANVPLVWVVHPPTRTVRIHRPRTAPPGPIAELREDDTISGEDVLPGFSCSIARFFE